MLSAIHSRTNSTFLSGSAVLLASPDPLLLANLQRILNSLGMCVEIVSTADRAIAAMQTMREQGILLLDVRLAGVSNGQLLAAVAGHEIRKRCAIALIADQVSDEWIARLREGVIDDIVPRNTDAAGWTTHLHSMQRGHELYCELENLRETTQLEVQHDRVTGVFNRDTMLTMLFRETDRVQRLRDALSTVLLELDDFAQLRQNFGSEATGNLLRDVAFRTSRMLRSYDLLGRSGPEAFLLALPGCSTINAMMLAERLRVEIFAEPFLITDSNGKKVEVPMTACYAVTSSRGRSPIVVLREAERTLVKAKLSGPDTLRCASESPLAAETAGPHLFPEVEMALW